MTRYIIVSTVSGILFGLLDGLIHANPLARRLFKVFEPIARESINVPAGVAIDLVYGFVMAGVYLLIQDSLPGEGWLLKGVSFGLIAWFFRVVMQAASQWMMYRVQAQTLLYILISGLLEMVILGFLYSVFL